MKSLTPIPIPRIDPDMRRNLRLMIAEMIGDEFSFTKQPFPIWRKDLPVDCQPIEGFILDAIAYLDDHSVAPTQQNIVDYLTVRKNVPNPADEIARLLVDKGDQAVSIRAMSVLYHAWASEQRLNVAGLKVSEIAQNPVLDYQEKWDNAYDLIMAQSPTGSFDEEDIGEEQFMWRVAEGNQKAVEARNSNMDVGPELPFLAQKALYTCHDFGEATIILGREGTGKTTMAQLIAENVAWTQRLNCDVVYYALETPLEVLSRRQFCRHNLVPYSAVRSGEINLGDSYWKPIFENWIMTGRKKSNASGFIRHFYSPAASVEAIGMSMLRSAETSRVLGRNVVFIVDHLHSIDWQATHSREGEYGALRSILLRLAAINNRANLRTRTHLFIMGQESNESPGQMFGGKFAAKRMQYVYAIERDKFEGGDDSTPAVAGHDSPVSITASEYKSILERAEKAGKGDHAKRFYSQDKHTPGVYNCLDAVGNQRYWFRKGDEYTEHMRLKLTKANDGKIGKIDLRFEAGMGRISQNPDQITELRMQKRLPRPRQAPQ